MNTTILKILIIGMLITIFLPAVNSAPTEWHNMPKTGKDAGEIFQLRFEIKSDETTNYTITLEPGEDFEVVDGNKSITIQIPIDATRTFIFDMKIKNNLEDGKHPIPYIALKNGTQFKTENIYVRAGIQTPGFEIPALISAITIALIIWKKNRK